MNRIFKHTWPDTMGARRSPRPSVPPAPHTTMSPARNTAPTPALPARVVLASHLTALEAVGGGEVQMLELARALPSAGVDARLWRPWEDRFQRGDVLHLFGSTPAHLPVVAAAQRQGIPVALSPITWFSWRSTWGAESSLPRRTTAIAKYAVRCALPGLPTWRRRLYQSVDVLLPNSCAEAEQLSRLFHVPRSRCQVVPNATSEHFAQPSGGPQDESLGTPGFVLYCGRIEPRKNQLGFLRAMRGESIPIVIVGGPVPGHEAYLAACQREAGHNVRFVPAVPHDSPLLTSAYAACGCLVLASWFETPGLVALEAAASGVPLVLTEFGSAREYFGQYARYVHPSDAAGLRRAVRAALGEPRSAVLAAHVQRHFTWSVVAHRMRDVYARLV